MERTKCCRTLAENSSIIPSSRNIWRVSGVERDMFTTRLSPVDPPASANIDRHAASSTAMGIWINEWSPRNAPLRSSMTARRSR